MISREQLDQLSFSVNLPITLAMNKNIERACIALYMFIVGLTRASGYCFASNKYLAICMNIDESSIKRLLNSLEEEGFIEIETHKDGLKWSRKIYAGVEFKKSLRRLKIEPSGVQKNFTKAQKQALEGLKISPYNKSSIYKKVDKETAASPSPSSKPIDPKPRTTAAAFSVEEELKRSQLSKEEKVRALRFYEAVKATQDWSKVGNRVGWVIHMIRVGKDLEVSKNHDLVEKRKAWAEKNQWDSPAGYMRVVKDGIALVTGSIEKMIKWEMPDAFWVARGLA